MKCVICKHDFDNGGEETIDMCEGCAKCLAAMNMMEKKGELKNATLDLKTKLNSRVDAIKLTFENRMNIIITDFYSYLDLLKGDLGKGIGSGSNEFELAVDEMIKIAKSDIEPLTKRKAIALRMHMWWMGRLQWDEPGQDDCPPPTCRKCGKINADPSEICVCGKYDDGRV